MIRDLERLLRVKNHVIRYWEKEIPLIQPKKDPFGRYRYSDRDLQILLRLKHLLHERHFTVEGAREELYRELSGEGQDLRAAMADLRSELLRLYDIVQGKT
jgi:DNA-binding transcriptional MerR regulator